MDVDTDRCEFCRFWVDMGINVGGDIGSGDCHRHAPAPNQHYYAEEFMRRFERFLAALEKREADYFDDDAVKLVQWPETASNDYCGDFQPATASAPASAPASAGMK